MVPGIIARMTDRDRPTMEGSPACPFIAYEDERDERSSEPDHAHRCYAEVRPAPRALAHQEAYCLSSAFPVCPTFQAWARREAAQARSAASASAAATAAGGAVAGGAAAARPPEPAPEPVPPAGARVNDESAYRSDDLPDEGRAPSGDPEGFDDPDDPPAQRNPPRDWAAPPPWAAGAAGASAAGRSSGEPPDFLAPRSTEGQGLAGSAADRLATGAPIEDPRPVPRAVPSNAPASPADPELAGLVGGAAAVSRYGSEPAVPPARPGKRPAVSSTRDKPVDRTPMQTGPSWESPRRYEAYPTIKTRTGMPDIPRVALIAGALAIAALALFFLPALLGIGSDDGDGPSASPSASVAPETAEPSPTEPPAPTAQVYVVVGGDTFTKIANKFGLTVEALKAANPDIKDINKISVGDDIVIPVVIPDEVTDPSAEPSP